METIPKEVKLVLEKLEKAGFEAFIVGGCVRDLILGRTPNDWDVATNAKPEEIQKVFPDSLYENRFGTVTVRIINRHPEEVLIRQLAEKDDEGTFTAKDSIETAKKTSVSEIQVTTYRIESKYSDKRHPDDVKFAKTLEEDLSRRDFTINAIALSNYELRITNYEFKNGKTKLNDYFNGQADIRDKVIRAVGDANERFDEDALRMMRAVRFSVQLGFKIEPKTAEAIKKNAKLMENISQERIRDELIKIIKTNQAAEGIELLRNLGLLRFVLPELEIGVGVSQNLHHIYSVYEHLILSLKHCPSNKLEVRLAALLHDIAKPRTKRGEGITSTFYNHDLLGAKFAKKALKRLRFPNEIVEKAGVLIKNHMFFYNVDEVSEAGIRRLVKRIGKENTKDLIDLRIADRLGSGVPKAKPYKLRHLEYMIEKVAQDPISVKMLKINGDEIMKLLNIKPGVKIGAMLDVLLAEVLEDPSKNTKEHLENRVKELYQIDLNQLREMAKERIEERKEEEDQVIKNKYWVK